MLMLIAKALLPVYVGLALGYFAGRRKLVDNINVSSLNSLLMQFALPLSLFLAIARSPSPEEPDRPHHADGRALRPGR